MADSYRTDTYTPGVRISFQSGAPLVGRTFLRPSAAGHGARVTT